MLDFIAIDVRGIMLFISSLHNQTVLFDFRFDRPDLSVYAEV